MLAAPISLPIDRNNGPRPIDLPKDSDSVIRLLDLTFGPLFGEQGQRQLGDRVLVNLNPPLLNRLSTSSWRFRPGYVWEEDGKLVANVTLVKSDIAGRYLMANVAVHPDYRQMGIGRRLLEEAIDYIEHLSGRDILLQVRHRNSAAIRFYEALGFKRVGAMIHWETTTSRLRPLMAEIDETSPIRKLRNSEWKLAHNLDKASLNPDLTWPMALTPKKYYRSLISKLDDFLGAQNKETWVVEKPKTNERGTIITGLINLKSEWRRPMRLELRVHPAAKGVVEKFLLTKGLSRLRTWRSGTIRITHPAEDDIVNSLLTSSNFKEKETLQVMRLSL